ncbi:hypothetical protein EV189_3952 [Motilibacter rhizosphaerae]|uniref:STAS domain-containing protein n=1 Tax=Motilibacter rhizosphaerae TaxID=598652 RepID=A0A4Q7N7C3_9ACTN|nr:STAS domain-containing protein [Motilibacter rhizosphaerae]RZS77913.1 hypothetical protein EV189_3952 [Motilibacter rhizosphaerae]
MDDQPDGFTQVRVLDEPGCLVLEISGDAPDRRIAEFRADVGGAVTGRPDGLVIDLTRLRSWEHEAQGFLLNLVRRERHRGRTVVVRGLKGTAAAQAQASGMRLLIVRGSGEPGLPPAQLVAASAATAPADVERDPRTHRPSRHTTCRFGHPGVAGSPRCDEGHLVLPL